MKSVLGRRGSDVVEDEVGVGVGRRRGGVAGAATWRVGVASGPRPGVVEVAHGLAAPGPRRGAGLAVLGPQLGVGRAAPGPRRSSNCLVRLRRGLALGVEDADNDGLRHSWREDGGHHDRNFGARER
jgi:hypothetical protein